MLLKLLISSIYLSELPWWMLTNPSANSLIYFIPNYLVLILLIYFKEEKE